MSALYQLEEVTELRDLDEGTQIAYKSLYKDISESMRFLYPLFGHDEYYYHHGMYLGNDRVAHFSGDRKEDAKPQECKLHKFIEGSADGKLFQVKFNEKVPMLRVNEILERAERMLQNPSEWPVFDIIENNCESFATWITTGNKCSQQVQVASINAVLAGVSALVTGVLSV